VTRTPRCLDRDCSLVLRAGSAVTTDAGNISTGVGCSHEEELGLAITSNKVMVGMAVQGI
jgi:hypothetical protein